MLLCKLSGTPELSLPNNNVSYFISKNTLTKIAAKNAGYEDKLDDILVGQIGIAYASDDPTAPARVIKNFGKEQGINVQVSLFI